MKNQQQDNAPREDLRNGKNIKKGLILVHTGDGKGKSTAAFGTAVRAIGQGLRVAMVQFIKGDWKTGEDKFFKQFPDQFDLYVMGEGFTWDTKSFDRDCASAQKAWQKCKEILNDPKYDLVIFDEINYVLKYNFLDENEVFTVLKTKPEYKHVILTGNGAPKKIIEFADLVTEMKCIKHPYQKGVLAQAGIDY